MLHGPQFVCHNKRRTFSVYFVTQGGARIIMVMREKWFGASCMSLRLEADALHTAAKSPFLFKKINFSIIPFLAGKFKLEVVVKLVKIEFLNKNWDFASVCFITVICFCAVYLLLLGLFSHSWKAELFAGQSLLCVQDFSCPTSRFQTIIPTTMNEKFFIEHVITFP